MTIRFLKVLAFAATIGSVSTAWADVVIEWNTAALNAIRTSRTAPPVASRALATLHASIYDAVNGISRSYEPYVVRDKGPSAASEEAAASAAAHTVLSTLFSASAATFDELHAKHLAAIRDGRHKRRGAEWGESVADRILLWRASDNADAIVEPPAGTGVGSWQPTPPSFAAYLLPQWGGVTPFAMPTNHFFRPKGPPSIESAEYARDYEQVRALGAAVGSVRTPEQDLIALFWADGVGTATPPGHWNVIAQNVAVARRNTLRDNARLFALLNIAMADAAICAWDAKYAYNFWRPVTAIRTGNDDGNPATVGDPSWSSFIVTPPFPDYVSGHSTFSGAAAAVLALFYGMARIPFSTTSDALPDVTRDFRSVWTAAREAAASRLYGGIHFSTANEDGLKAGVAIGFWAFATTAQPRRQGREW